MASGAVVCQSNQKPLFLVHYWYLRIYSDTYTFLVKQMLVVDLIGSVGMFACSTCAFCHAYTMISCLFSLPGT